MNVPTPDDTGARARGLVERFLLAPGQSVSQTRRVGDAFIVEADEWWQVERVDRWRNFRKSDLYDLFEARLYLFADPPPTPHGFGIPCPGEVFHLNDADQLRRFFAALPELLSGVELAGLLTRYAATDLGGAQALVLSSDDLRTLIHPEHLEMMSEAVRFKSRRLADDGLELDFCSYSIATRDNGPHRVDVSRWHVEARAPSDVQWHVDSLAVGLPSPLYG
ncbi:MAG: hypothetical protein JO352_01545 [Chloroflexi bacterium]|nr:hypothetical protein [Chloroflexota bacterium]MBV9600683.1 hypothetical protein [Chloroflexota bacterium]